MVSGAEKVFYITLGIMFLALSVVGLIIPIIPGVLFLAGAVYMLSRGSHRVREYTESHPKLSKLHERMERFDAVSALGKAQVAALVTVEAAAVGARKIVTGIRRLVV